MAHDGRGNTLRTLGRLTEALAAHDRALELDPTRALSHANRACALADMGRLEEALAANDRAIQLDSSLALAHSNRGATLQALGRLDDAIASHDRAVGLDPGPALFHYNRGYALRELRRLEDALAAYNRAIECDPTLWEAYEWRANVLVNLGRLDEALSPPSAKIAPAEAHFQRAEAFFALGRLQEALSDFARAVQIKPNLWRAHAHMACALNNLGGFEEALQSVERALEAAPARKQADLYYYRGFALRCLGRLDEAEAGIDRALELDRSHAPAWDTRGIILADRGKHAEALAAYEEAARLGVTQGLAHLLADCEDPKFRDPPRAVALARRMTDAYPRLPQTWCLLATALCRAGAWQDCLVALERASALAPGRSVEHMWFVGAIALQRFGKREEAVTWYEKGRTWLREVERTDPGAERWRAEATEVLGIKEPKK